MFYFNKSFEFEIHTLEKLATTNAPSYARAAPFPHIVIDDFLPTSVAKYAERKFPKPTSNIWLDWKVRNTEHQPRKMGIGHASRLVGVAPGIMNLLHVFNSYPFINFLEKMTGISKLLPDPYFHGAGLHQTINEGKLDVHADFNYLKKLDLYRRVNVLLYLNTDWQSKYNGYLELWNKDMTKCVASIAPTLNRLVVFETNKTSYHGHPDRLNVPSQVTRKSIALYYYTALPAEGESYDRITNWKKT